MSLNEGELRINMQSGKDRNPGLVRQSGIDMAPKEQTTGSVAEGFYSQEVTTPQSVQYPDVSKLKVTYPQVTVIKPRGRRGPYFGHK